AGFTPPQPSPASQGRGWKLQCCERAGVPAPSLSPEVKGRVGEGCLWSLRFGVGLLELLCLRVSVRALAPRALPLPNPPLLRKGGGRSCSAAKGLGCLRPPFHRR